MPVPPSIAVFVAYWPKLSETFVLDEVRGFERLGWNVRLVSIRPWHEPTAHAGVARVKAPHHCLDLRARKLEGLRAVLDAFAAQPLRFARAAALSLRFGESPARLAQACLAWRELRRERVDVLYAHFFAPGELAALVAELSGRPFVLRLHGLRPGFESRPGLRALLARARRVLTVSRRAENLVAELSGAGNVRCEYNPVPDEFFLPEAPRESGAPRLLAVSRLLPEKGLRYLIEACALLKRAGTPFSCRIIGDGPERPALESLIRERGLQEDVVLAGEARQEQIREALSQADVFVVPSVRGGDELPRALTEAMAAGVCPVATRVAGIPELVEDGVNGLLVAEGDARALAAACGRVLADPALRARFGMEARRTARGRCDAGAAMRRLAAVAGGAA